jgi:amyloid beta precursor protein binding protein 1
MKASTDAYINLQKLYKDQAEREKNTFKNFISPDVQISDDLIDSLVKNAHALKVIRGTAWNAIDKNATALGQHAVSYVNPLILTFINVGDATTASPKQLAIHLALSAASCLASKAPATPEGELPVFTIEALTQEAQSLLPPGTELPEEFEYTGGEM